MIKRITTPACTSLCFLAFYLYFSSQINHELKRSLEQLRVERTGLLAKSEELRQIAAGATLILSDALTALYGEQMSLIVMESLQDESKSKLLALD